MKRRISLLVAATTSAVILAFLIPLALLVRGIASDRAIADGEAEARNVAILVSSLHETPGLREAVEAIDARSPAITTVSLAEGDQFGSGRVAPDDPDVARAREGSAFSLTDSAGRRTYVPVLTSNGTDVVLTEVTRDQLRAGVLRAWIVLGVLGSLMLVAALAIAEQIGRRIATPVMKVAETADQLREGDLSARAVIAGPPETQALATSLNRLGERISELLVAERAAVGDLSHRLRTPVTALRIDLESVPDPQVAERLRHHVGNLQRTIDAIVNDARRPLRHQVTASCDGAAVVAARAAFWAVLAEDQGRRLDLTLHPGPVRLPLDAPDLADVVDIVIDNVFAHTPEGTDFAVSFEADADAAVLRVVDRGGATDGPEHDTTGKTGLGLQIARRTVAAAAGTLAFDSDPDTGTAVTIRIPLNAEDTTI